MMKRTEQSFKNLQVNIIGQSINFVISFVLRTAVITKLGVEYLGLLGTFGDIFRILSLAELGFANVLYFRLYRPIALKDDEKVVAILGYFAKAYRKIGCLVAFGGFICIPILPNILTGVNNIEKVVLFYILCLVNTVISYFYAYKKAVIIAHQEAYVVSRIEYFILIIQDILQVIVIWAFNSFTMYLVIQVTSTLTQNICTSRTASKRYPYIDEKKILGEDEKNSIRKDVLSLFGYRVGSVVITSTDSLIISKFISTIAVGVYSNYLLVTTALNSIVAQIFDACKASVGNLNVLESQQKKYDIYRIMAFISFWIYGVCSIGLYCFINPLFGMIWSEAYLLDENIVFLIVIQFYLLGMMKNVSELYINALGLFRYVRMYPIICAVLNIFLSIIGVQFVGLIGVFWGTILSFMVTYFWAWPFVVFKKGINHNVLDYYILYLKYSGITIVIGAICNKICRAILSSGILNFFISGIIIFLLINIMFFAVTFRTIEFRWVYNNGKKFATKIFKRGSERK